MTTPRMSGTRAMPPGLLDVIANVTGAPVSPAFRELADHARADFGDSAWAVLLYGSCLRVNDPAAGVVDLLIIMENYDCLPSPLQRLAGRLLPPNVYFLEHVVARTILRCKYAAISLGDFEAGTGGALEPYLWARFAQPSRLLFVREETMRPRVNAAIASAVVCFLRNAVPAMTGERFGTTDLWQRGLALSYGAELRPESTRRPESLIADSGYYERVTAAAIPALPDLLSGKDGVWQTLATRPARRACLFRWRLRRIQGTLLSLLRWIKAAFTFSGGVDYAAWKIERHTGMRIEVTERLRRHPLIYGWPVLWKLWRSGTLR